jgi:hypothetical protein
MVLGALIDNSAVASTACPDSVAIVAPADSLSHVIAARAIGRKIKIVIVASQPSTEMDASLDGWRYSDRLGYWLARHWGQKSVALTTLHRPDRTALQIAAEMPAILTKYRPTLLVLEAGTVDAAEGVDLEVFSEALEQNLRLITESNVDLVLVDGQHDGEFGLWSAASSYVEVMAQVVRGYPVMLFPRYEITQQWVLLHGAPTSPQSSFLALERVRRLNDCLGRTLADAIIDADRQDY